MQRRDTLIECQEVKGGAAISHADLVCEQISDALFIPLGLQHPAGLYDEDGKIIRLAAYFRGLPHPHFPLEAESTTARANEASEAPSGYTYVFGGHFTAHYGHFVFAMLSRLWALPQPVPPELRIVLLACGDPEEPFKHEFSATILRAIGLSPDNFASFNQPVRFREILVPEAGVEENHAGHLQFADFCNDLGLRILGRRTSPTQERPVFLTKQFVRNGVHSILNEDVVCSNLQKRGVEIVAPEKLALSEQIAIWAERPVVAGMFGSALHTSLFAKGRSYIALNPQRWINSNQVIIDRVNGNSATVLYPDDDYLNDGPRDGMDYRLRLRNPQAAARQLWRRIEQQTEAARAARRKPWWPPALARPIAR